MTEMTLGVKIGMIALILLFVVSIVLYHMWMDRSLGGSRAGSKTAPDTPPRHDRDRTGG